MVLDKVGEFISIWEVFYADILYYHRILVEPNYSVLKEMIFANTSNKPPVTE